MSIPRLAGACRRYVTTSCLEPISSGTLYRHHARLPYLVHRRGAKSTVVTKIKDLPQGALGPVLTEAVLEDEETPTYPRVIQQHFNNVRKFNDCVVLTRVGNFYELSGEQAEKLAPLLNLKVARRKTALGPVAMAGFQIFQLDRYLKTLVQDLNKPVAISEEIRNTAADEIKSGDLKYDRKVTRVITAGTLIDETFVDPYENNFLLSIVSEAPLTVPRIDVDGVASDDPDTTVGLSWVDLSSGDFYTQETTAKALPSMVARIAPREILLHSSLQDEDNSKLQSLLGNANFTLNYHDKSDIYDNIAAWNDLLDRPIDIETVFTLPEVSAASLMLDYVQSKLQDVKVTLRPPVRRTDEDSMRIDKHTMQGLEIRCTLRDGFFQGSLLHVVRRTVTKSGARALTRRLVSPEMSLTTINERLDLVEEMLEYRDLRDTVSSMLQRTLDTPRLVQKFSLGRGDADDLLGIGKTIDIMQQLFEQISEHTKLDAESTKRLRSVTREIELIDFAKLGKLSKRIQSSIDEEGLSRQQLAEQDQAMELTDFAEQVVENGESGKKVKKPSTKREEPFADVEIWIMRRNASQTLLRTHRELHDRYKARSELADSLRETLGASSLSLKWTPHLGHFCHVKGKDCKLEIPGARNLSSSKTTRSFHLPAWTSLGQQMENVKHRIRAEEARVFASLRADVIAQLVKLRRCSSVLDDLDIACSSASLAAERSLVRPSLHAGTTQTIINGRHPMVDQHLRSAGRSFTPNDCLLSAKEIALLITGPNMAGKSTFLRQNALIAILAQTGCYVPADYAHLGLVDRVFSRVGAADDLSNAQSTFMVEMAEAALILGSATRRSLVVMDEVGRGTAPDAGRAVAEACLRYLVQRVGCRTLFATHFHDLADGTGDLERVGRWCTDVEEGEQGWRFVHRLRRGVNRDSHAFKVARLAGLPEEAVRMAEEIMRRTEGREEHRVEERAAAAG